MLNNYESKIAGTQEIFDQISKSLLGELQNIELHEVEEVLFQYMMKLGLSFLNAYIKKKGTGKNLEASLPYHKTETWNYISIFGDIGIPNAYFWKKSYCSVTYKNGDSRK